RTRDAEGDVAAAEILAQALLPCGELRQAEFLHALVGEHGVARATGEGPELVAGDRLDADLLAGGLKDFAGELAPRTTAFAGDVENAVGLDVEERDDGRGEVERERRAADLVVHDGQAAA